MTKVYVVMEGVKPLLRCKSRQEAERFINFRTAAMPPNGLYWIREI